MAKDSWGKVKNLLGLEIEDEYDEDEYIEEEYEEETVEERNSTKKLKREKVPISSNTDSISGNSKVVVVEPEFLNDAPAICDNLKNHKTVVVNLENADYEEGRKIFDFLNGAVYALDGTIQKISENVFILAPNSVDIITESTDSLTNRNILDWN